MQICILNRYHRHLAQPRRIPRRSPWSPWLQILFESPRFQERKQCFKRTCFAGLIVNFGDANISYQFQAPPFCTANHCSHRLVLPAVQHKPAELVRVNPPAQYPRRKAGSAAAPLQLIQPFRKPDGGKPENPRRRVLQEADMRLS